MHGNLTILDRLDVFADCGKTSASLKLWENQFFRLRDIGFDVDPIAPSERAGEYHCRIEWAYPTGQAAYEMLGRSIQSTWYGSL